MGEQAEEADAKSEGVWGGLGSQGDSRRSGSRVVDSGGISSPETYQIRPR